MNWNVMSKGRIYHEEGEAAAPEEGVAASRVDDIKRMNR